MLRYLRKREGLSQAELATKLKLSQSTIGMYETGRREPDFEVLESIADFFNVDMNFLLGKYDNDSALVESTVSLSNNKHLQMVSVKMSQMSNTSKIRLLRYADLLLDEQDERHNH